MLCDIGNGTMNILQIIDRMPDGRQMFTEKYGVQQCILAMREALMREHNANPGEKILHRFLRKGTAGLDAALEETMRATAEKYTKEVFRVLREHGYDSRLMKLYVVGGGGCMLKNFASLNNTAVIINDDICATAKGYEHLALREISKNEKMPEIKKITLRLNTHVPEEKPVYEFFSADRKPYRKKNHHNGSGGCTAL